VDADRTLRYADVMATATDIRHLTGETFDDVLVQKAFDQAFDERARLLALLEAAQPFVSGALRTRIDAELDAASG
jgi:hypothetical protein